MDKLLKISKVRNFVYMLYSNGIYYVFKILSEYFVYTMCINFESVQIILKLYILCV